MIVYASRINPTRVTKMPGMRENIPTEAAGLSNDLAGFLAPLLGPFIG